MEAKIGDRVSFDAKKVGQPRRAGVIRVVTRGLAGIRYQIRWDDGAESMIAPGGGNLIVEGRSGNGARKPAAKPKPKPRTKTKTKAAVKTKKSPKAKAQTKKKSGTKKKKAKRR